MISFRHLRAAIFNAGIPVEVVLTVYFLTITEGEDILILVIEEGALRSFYEDGRCWRLSPRTWFNFLDKVRDEESEDQCHWGSHEVRNKSN